MDLGKVVGPELSSFSAVSSLGTRGGSLVDGVSLDSSAGVWLVSESILDYLN